VRPQMDAPRIETGDYTIALVYNPPIIGGLHVSEGN
jgi:hypothetical protein